MVVLKEASEWVSQNLIDDDTLAILLVGAWSRGEGNDTEDIDVISIKQFQLAPIYNEEHHLEEFGLDVWVYDKDSFISDLYIEILDANQLTNTSLIVKILQEHIIWYQSEPFLDDHIKKANNCFSNIYHWRN